MSDLFSVTVIVIKLIAQHGVEGHSLEEESELKTVYKADKNLRESQYKVERPSKVYSKLTSVDC